MPSSYFNFSETEEAVIKLMFCPISVLLELDNAIIEHLSINRTLLGLSSYLGEYQVNSCIRS